MGVWHDLDDLSPYDILTAEHMDDIRENINYLLSPNNAGEVRNNAADYTTTSQTFVDVDAVNLARTITTHGGPVLILVSVSGYMNAVNYSGALDVEVDGTRIGSAHSFGLTRFHGVGGAAYAQNLSFACLKTGLSAGEHTFKLQFRCNGSTFGLYCQPGHTGVGFWVVEI